MKLKRIRAKADPQKSLELMHSEIKKTFGLTLFEYNQMYMKNDGCCHICGRHQSEFERRFAIDHCHQTGKIRGLLCTRCNQGIGMLQDSIEIMEKAIKYLKGTK